MFKSIRRSLPAKIMLVMASLYFASLAMIGYLNFSASYSIFTWAQEEFCLNACDLAAASLRIENDSPAHLNARWSAALDHIRKLDVVDGVETLALLDSDGSVLTQFGDRQIEQHPLSKQSMDELLSGKRAVHFDLNAAKGYALRPVFEPELSNIAISGRHPRALYLVVDVTEPMTMFEHAFIERATAFFVSFTALAFALYLVVHRTVLRPVRAITDSAARFVDGNFETTATIARADSSGDALQRLAASFNKMMERIHADRANMVRQTAELYEKEERFRGIFENAVVGMFQTTMDGKFISANQALANILGFASPEDLIRERTDNATQSYLHAGDRARYVRELLEHGVVKEFECQALRRDGTVIWISGTGKVVCDQHGTLLYFEGTIIDITDRKRIQESLDRERVFRETIQNSIQTGLATIDCDGRQTYVNPAFCRMVGWSADELVGQTPPYSYFPPEQSEWFAASLREHLTRHPDVGEFRTTFVRKNGEHFQVDIVTSPLLGLDGAPTGWLGSVTDNTESRRAEAALRASEARFRALIENGQDLIAIVGPDGLFRYVSPSFARILGFQPEALIGSAAAAYLAPEDAALAPELFERMLSDPTGSEHGEIKFRCADGSYRDIDLSGFNMVGEPSVAGLVFTGRDITERKQFEAQLQHTQKLEGLGVLAGGIAHDFNNLLMGILGHASMALLDLPPGTPMQKSLHHIEKSASRAADLCLQLLAYSGKGKFEVRPIRLSDLVSEMLHLLEVSIGKNVLLKCELGDEIPVIRGDATQLRQIVMNLITNASDAIGEGPGVLTVRTRAIHCTGEFFEDAYLAEKKPEGEYVMFEVQDTGSGMDANTMSRIFDPFFTTKFAGRGLGLASVLGIARGHRAAIKVKSKVGEGTSFTILFPSMSIQPLLEIDVPQTPGKCEFAGTVLVVDDEPMVRDVTRQMLQRLGMTVFEAHDGVEAVNVYERHGHAIDLIMLDVTMPNMNGDEAYRLIRKIDGNARVILCSGYTEVDTVEAMKLEGLAGFLHKPYKIEGLIAKLAEVLN